MEAQRRLKAVVDFFSKRKNEKELRNIVETLDDLRKKKEWRAEEVGYSDLKAANRRTEVLNLFLHALRRMKAPQRIEFLDGLEENTDIGFDSFHAAQKTAADPSGARRPAAHWKMDSVERGSVPDASGRHVDLQVGEGREPIDDKLFGRCLELTPGASLATYNYLLWPEDSISFARQYTDEFEPRSFTFEAWVKGDEDGELLCDSGVEWRVQGGKAEAKWPGKWEGLPVSDSVSAELRLLPGRWNHLALRLRSTGEKSEPYGSGRKVALFVNGRNVFEDWVRWEYHQAGREIAFKTDWDWLAKGGKGQAGPPGFRLAPKWQGRLGPVRVYSEALSDDQIQDDVAADLKAAEERNPGYFRSDRREFQNWLERQAKWPSKTATEFLERLYGSQEPADGPAAHWKMQAVQEQGVVLDTSDHHVDLRVQGSCQRVADELFGHCLALAPAAGLVTHTYQLWPEEALSPARQWTEKFECGSFTFEAWVQGDGELLSVSGLTWTVVAAATAAAGGLSGGGPKIQVKLPNGTVCPFSLAPSPGVWNHLALVLENGKLRLFVNGQQAPETPEAVIFLKIDWNFKQKQAGDGQLHLAPAWRGRLGPVRIYRQARTEEQVQTDIQSDLPEIKAGAIFPLDFDLYNHQHQQVLYANRRHDDAHGTDREPQALYLEVTNVGRRSVLLPATPAAAGQDGEAADGGAQSRPAKGSAESHLELRFRPGILKSKTLTKVKWEAVGAGGAPLPDRVDGHGAASPPWRMTTREVKDDEHAVFHFFHGNGAGSGDAALAPGEAFTLKLSGLQTNARAQATRVQLRYRLRYDDGTPVDGSRQHHLRVLQWDDHEVQKHLEVLDGRAREGGDLDQNDKKIRKKAKEDVTVLRRDTDLKCLKLKKDLEDKIDKVAHKEKLEQKEIGIIRARLTQEASLIADLESEIGSLRRAPLIASVKVKDASGIKMDGSKNELTLTISAPPPSGAEAPPVPLELSEKSELIVHYLYSEDNPWGVMTSTDAKLLKPSAAGGWLVEKEEKTGTISIRPGDGSKFPIKLRLTGFTCSAPVGPARFLIQYKNVGSEFGNGKVKVQPSGWLGAPVDRSPVVSSDRRTTRVAGGLLLESQPRLEFRHKPRKTMDEESIDAAVTAGDGGPLVAVSRSSIALYPGVDPSAATLTAGKGVKVESEDNEVVLKVEGSLSVEGGVEAAGRHIHAASLTLSGGPLVVEGDVRPTANAEGSFLVPEYGIIMWHGKANDIPPGWALCDGTRGTPDLRSHFVVGAFAPDTYYDGTPPGKPAVHAPDAKEPRLLTPHPPGTEEGRERVGLRVDQLPRHSHKTEVTVEDHAHTLGEMGWSSTDDDDDSLPVWANGRSARDIAANRRVMTDKAAPVAKVTDHAAGGDQEHENLPPYYALYFIMRRPEEA